MSNHLFFVAPSAYPLGGVAVWLDYLIPGLECEGWQVTLGLVGGYHHDVPAYCRVYPGLRNVVEIRNPTGSRAGRINSLDRVFERHMPDLVVGVNILDTYEAVNRLREKKISAPRVAMAIHGIQPDLLDDMADYRDVLDGVVCTNRLTMRLAHKDAGIEPSRLFYAPYGVKPVSENSAAKKRSGKKMTIAWVGRIEQPQKRIWDLVEIVRELAGRNRDFEVILAGRGSEEDELRKVLDALNLTGFVSFLGMVPPEKMQSLVYDRSDALLVTSFWETGPIVIWEAMAAGVPVVSTRYIGSGLEGGLVAGENCLLFAVGDCVSAADQLENLCEAELFQRLVTGGYSLVEERYSVASSIGEWDTAFRKILDLVERTSAPHRHFSFVGRLDRLLGIRWGEQVRSLLGIGHQHASAGGEWPHSYGERGIDDALFWKKVESYDQGDQAKVQ